METVIMRKYVRVRDFRTFPHVLCHLQIASVPICSHRLSTAAAGVLSQGFSLSAAQIPDHWGAYRALCARCAKSWLFSTTGSSVLSED